MTLAIPVLTIPALPLPGTGSFGTGLIATASAQALDGSAAALSAARQQSVMPPILAATRTKPAEPAPAPTRKEPPPRIPFTAADDAVAAIPGMPDARFWSDSEADFKAALPEKPGPWLVLSSGGSDGAFGAGLLNGLSAAGKRPDYSVVTGVSSGALMAPYAFAGAKYDDALRESYTKITAADVFEAGGSAESFADSWPLRDMIKKRITPEFLADVAAAHNSGRRLFIATYDLDSERGVLWNMGAIAAHGGDAALKLFRTVVLASASIPGGFPPVLIDVEGNGKKFQEMHADGGLGGQFFVVPLPLLAPTSDWKLPATELDIVVNTSLVRDFQVVERFVPNILTQSVGGAVKVDTRLMLDLAQVLARKSGVAFNIATIPYSFNMPSRGAFDSAYMNALYQLGFEQGKGTAAFASQLPPDPGAPPSHPSRIEKTGVK
jgi:hypothetical protein